MNNMKKLNFSSLSPQSKRLNKTILSPEAKAKRRQFKTKFNIDKEKLNETDIINIINSIEKKKNEKLDVEKVSKKLMNKLDINNNGKTNDLIEEIVMRNGDLIEDELTLFYKKINEILLSKSEEIILKLRKLQNKDWVKLNENYIPIIENIINMISEQNFYDFENQILDFSNDNEGEQFLMKYSQLEDSNRKEKDFI